MNKKPVCEFTIKQGEHFILHVEHKNGYSSYKIESTEEGTLVGNKMPSKEVQEL
jgi:hypothetical protein